MIMSKFPPKPEKAVHYLGLLAHFWQAGGTMKERARLSLKKLHCQTGICECLQTAKKHHAAITQFDTVDKLESLRAEICKNSSKVSSGSRRPKRPRTHVKSYLPSAAT
jgi:hypothetical protein